MIIERNSQEKSSKINKTLKIYFKVSLKNLHFINLKWENLIYIKKDFNYLFLKVKLKSKSQTDVSFHSPTLKS